MACRDSRIVARHRGLDLGGRSATPLDCARRGDPHDGPVEFETRTLFKFDSQPRLSLTRVDIRYAERRDALLQTPPCLSSTPPPRPSSCVGASPHATHFVYSYCAIDIRDGCAAFRRPPSNCRPSSTPPPTPSALRRDAQLRPRRAGAASSSVVAIRGRPWTFSSSRVASITRPPSRDGLRRARPRPGHRRRVARRQHDGQGSDRDPVHGGRRRYRGVDPQE